MPVTINQNKVKFKHPTQQGFIEFNSIAESTSAELEANLRAVGQEVLATIPDNYETLNNKVNGIVKFQDTAPSTSSTTQVWVDTSSNAQQVAIPTMEEFDNLKNTVDPIKPAVNNSISTSKNLLWISSEYLNTNLNGIVITRSDDGEKYIVNGETTAPTYIRINRSRYGNENSGLSAGTPYTFSFTDMNGFSSSTSRIALKYNYDGVSALITIVSQNTTARTKTIPSFESEPYLMMFFQSGDVFTNATFKLQIEEGSTVTEYTAPAGIIDYEARKAIPILEEVQEDVSDIQTELSNVVIHTGNMFYFTNPDDSIFTTGGRNGITITKNFDGSFTINGHANTGIRVVIGNNNQVLLSENPWLIAGTTYSFGIEVVSGEYLSGADVSLRAGTTTNVVANLTSIPSSTQTFEEPAFCYLAIISGAELNNLRIRVIINVGNTLIDYVPHIDVSDFIARNEISEIQEAIAYNYDVEKANSDSFAIEDDRYENIEYIDVLSNVSSMSYTNGTSAEYDANLKFQHQPRSLKYTTKNESATCQTTLTMANGFPILGTQEIDLFVYVKNPELIGDSNHVLRMQGLDSGFSKYYNDTLSVGWNKIRFITEGAGTIDFTKTETRIRVSVYATAKVSVWIGEIIVVKPDKANIIVIDDAPYKTFYDYAYPALTQIGVPVTWAGDWSCVGDGIHTNVITDTELAVLKADGLSEFSFHNFDGTLQNVEPSVPGGPYNPNATKFTALADTVNNIRYLRENGMEPNRIWRAAWQGNNCTYPELANEEVDASASYNNTSGFIQFPFPDRYNIPRFALQGRTTSVVDTLFSKLEHQHSTIFVYTHGIGGPEPDEPGGDTNKDVSVGLLSYYVSKIQAGIQAGWLNATTYNRLMNHYRRIR